MIIEKVEPFSIAEEIELQPGDELIAINNETIRDIIDYRFHIADEMVTLLVRRGDEQFEVAIEKEPDEDLGLSFIPMKYRSCGNKCVFCFVDQNPDHLRSNLYFKDEDYRLSFLHGNYVTMTNISRNDLQRIVTQRLSPLYISVHATDLSVRKKMLGLRNDDRLLEKIAYLAQHRIDIHAQIVLCPGFNDGSVLMRTLDDLQQFYPQLKTVAIVPVGLTRHRDRLFPLKPVDRHIAKSVIQATEPYAESCLVNHGSRFVYLADEFYLKAGQPIPVAERYENFDQYENGVGMLRYFMDEFNEQISLFPTEIASSKKVRLVTAKLAAPYLLETVKLALNRVNNLHVDVTIITNYFYGDNIRVTGLLTGRDVIDQLKYLPTYDLIVLPSNCLNTDGVMLDDLQPADLEAQLGQKVVVLGLDFSELFAYL